MNSVIPNYVIIEFNHEAICALHEIRKVCLQQGGSTLDIDALMSAAIDSLRHDYDCTFDERKFDNFTNTVTEPLINSTTSANFLDELHIYLEILHVEIYKLLKTLGFYKLGEMPYEFDKFISDTTILVRRS